MQTPQPVSVKCLLSCHQKQQREGGKGKEFKKLSVYTYVYIFTQRDTSTGTNTFDFFFSIYVCKAITVEFYEVNILKWRKEKSATFYKWETRTINDLEE